MRFQKHESVPKARTLSVSLPETDLLALINEAEDLERGLSALRGAAYGISYSINNQTIKGDEVESLLILISQKLDQHTAKVIEGIMALTHQRRSTDQKVGQ